jgi:hypothetical protein
MTAVSQAFVDVASEFAHRSGEEAGRRRSGDPTRPRTQFPGFVLDRGRYRTIEAADPGAWQFPFDVNDRGQITGEYVRVGPDGIPDTFTPTPPATAGALATDQLFTIQQIIAIIPGQSKIAFDPFGDCMDR